MALTVEQAIQEIEKIRRRLPYTPASSIEEDIQWAMENKSMSREDAIFYCLKVLNSLVFR